MQNYTIKYNNTHTHIKLRTLNIFNHAKCYITKWRRILLSENNPLGSMLHKELTKYLIGSDSAIQRDQDLCWSNEVLVCVATVAVSTEQLCCGINPRIHSACGIINLYSIKRNKFICIYWNCQSRNGLTQISVSFVK